MRGKFEGKRVIGFLLGPQAEGPCACCLKGTVGNETWGLYERWRTNIELRQLNNIYRQYSNYLLAGKKMGNSAEPLVRERKRSVWSGGTAAVGKSASSKNTKSNGKREEQYQMPGAPLRKAEIRKNLILNRLLDSDREVEELHPPWKSAGSVSKLEQALEMYRIDLRHGRHHVRSFFFFSFCFLVNELMLLWSGIVGCFFSCT